MATTTSVNRLGVTWFENRSFPSDPEALGLHSLNTSTEGEYIDSKPNLLT